MQKVVEFTYKGRSTTYLYLANIGEVCSRSRDSEGVVWWWGGGWGRVYLGVHTEASFGENALLRWHFA